MEASTQNVPSNIDFATEVKSDRLALLYKFTIGLSIIIIIFASTLVSAVDEFQFEGWIAAPITLIGFCMITRFLLKRQQFGLGAIAYASGGIVAVGVAMTDGNELTAQIAPFVFVVVIFIAGLLLKPQWTVIFAIVSSVLTIVVPALSTGGWDFLSGHQVFAIVLMFISALLAAQVTGELYAVTEWALLNYQRERRTSNDLFEKRQELQKTLRRSEALSDKLKDTNVELEKAHESAEAAKNFRGQFLANMSHELRTPLNAIIGFSETMLKFPVMYDDENLPEKYRTDLNQIYNSGRQLLHVINDILDLAKVDAGKLEVIMEPVDLKPIIEAVIATARGLIGEKDIKLTTDLPDLLHMSWADETRVRQVLLNLYSNAVKFTEKGAILLTVKEEENDITFCVSDTGVGIRSEQLGTIFEEFHQAEVHGRDPRQGSGLGLAISQQLLTLMGGRIWVESVVGEGSKFYFTLQRYDQTKHTVAKPTLPDIQEQVVVQKPATKTDSTEMKITPEAKPVEESSETIRSDTPQEVS
jgi:signal transduction histidine kinase